MNTADLRTDLQKALLDRPHEMVLNWADWHADVRPTLERAVLGSGRVTETCGERRRWIDVLDWPFTDRDLVGPYLGWLGAECGVRTTAGCADLALLDLPSPLVYDGRRHEGEYAYVDLTAAFWSIYTKVTLDLRASLRDSALHVGLGGCDLGLHADLLAGDSVARNSLVGIARQTRRQVVTDGAIGQHVGPGKWCSPGLWAFIVGVLSPLARYALSLGAVLVATDGYVLPLPAVGAMRAEVARWGLHCHVRAAGASLVTGVGSWRVGELSTARVRERPGPAVRHLADVELSPSARELLAA